MIRFYDSCTESHTLLYCIYSAMIQMMHHMIVSFSAINSGSVNTLIHISVQFYL